MNTIRLPIPQAKSCPIFRCQVPKYRLQLQLEVALTSTSCLRRSSLLSNAAASRNLVSMPQYHSITTLGRRGHKLWRACSNIYWYRKIGNSGSRYAQERTHSQIRSPAFPTMKIGALYWLYSSTTYISIGIFYSENTLSY